MFSSLLVITPRDNDTLTLRQGRALALVVCLLIGVLAALAGFTFLTSDHPLDKQIGTVVQVVVYAAVYAINRSGRVRLAVTIFLCDLAAAPIIFALVGQSPFPGVFFFTLPVVVATAFGRPRSPLIWAAGLTIATFAINLILYQSLLAPTQVIQIPGGRTLPSLFTIEILAIVIVWMVAGAAHLNSRLLYQAIGESQAAAARAEAAQRELVTKQDDLNHQNEELRQAHERLEAMVKALTVPVVPVADGVGMLPLVGPLDAKRMTEVEGKTLTMVASQRLRALVIDLSGASDLEIDGVRALARLCGALRLLGVGSVLAGLSAQNAITLSSVDIGLPRTSATVQDALSTLGRRGWNN
jgi:anti-anti-sigma regulatory factor